MFRAVNRDKNKQRQTLDSGNVGNAHDILGGETLPASPNPNEQEATEYDALPPIMKLDTITKYKILQTESGGRIEGYSSFLALSEKMDHDFRDFFPSPYHQGYMEYAQNNICLYPCFRQLNPLL